MQFTGYRDFYGNEDFRNLMEYMAGYTVTPFRKHLTFGDASAETKKAYGDLYDFEFPSASAAFYRMHKISPEAERLAAWHVNGTRPRGYLTNYVVHDKKLGYNGIPTSRIFDEGAYFWEKNPEKNEEALMGAIQSNSRGGSHVHPDVNGLHLTAYGETILRNVGYAGYSNGCGSFDWGYFNGGAHGNSVIIFNGQNHKDEDGGRGIVEGFVSDGLDFARSWSGWDRTHRNAEHYRGLVLVQPTAEAEGYFAVWDDIRSGNSNGTITTIWRPYSMTSDGVQTTPNTEYDFSIDAYKNGNNDVKLAFFLADAPQSVQFPDAPFGQSHWNYYIDCKIGKAFHPAYSLNSEGKKSVLTVMFPYDGSHLRPIMEQLNISGGSAMRISHQSGAEDLLMGFTERTSFASAGVSGDRQGILYRKNSAGPSLLFARNTIRFDNQEVKKFGFAANNEVAIHLNKETQSGGIFVSQATQLTLYCPGIKGINQAEGIQVTSTHTDSISMVVPPGSHSFGLQMGPTAIQALHPTRNPLPQAKKYDLKGRILEWLKKPKTTPSFKPKREVK